MFEGLVRMNPKTTLVGAGARDVVGARRGRDHLDVPSAEGRHLARRRRRSRPTTSRSRSRRSSIPKVPNSSKHVLTVGGQPIRAEVVDPHTVKLILAEPFAPLLEQHRVRASCRSTFSERRCADGTFAQTWGIDTPPEKIVGDRTRIAWRATSRRSSCSTRSNPTYWMQRRERRCASRGSPSARSLIVPDQNTMYSEVPRPPAPRVLAAARREIDDLRKRSDELEITLTKIGLDTGMLFVSFNRNPAHYVKDGTTRSAARLVHGSEVRAGDRAQRRHEEHDPEHLLRVRRARGVVDLAREQAVFYDPEPEALRVRSRARAPLARRGRAIAIATATASARTPRASRSSSSSRPTPATRCANGSARSSRRTGRSSASR